MGLSSPAKGPSSPTAGGRVLRLMGPSSSGVDFSAGPTSPGPTSPRGIAAQLPSNGRMENYRKSTLADRPKISLVNNCFVC